MRPIPNQTKNDIINSMYSLSIIIPLYNEQERILKSLEILRKYIKKNKKNKIEIIFVSDGSTDQTNNIIRLFIKNNKLRTTIPKIFFINILTQFSIFYFSITYDTRLTQYIKILKNLSSLFKFSKRFYRQKGTCVRLIT